MSSTAQPLSELCPSEKRALLTRLMQERSEQPRTYPVSYSQQRLWFLDRLTPGNPFYSVAVAVRIKAPLQASALEKAINEIARRHESLRTTFSESDGEPRQVVAPRLNLQLPVVDLQHLPSEQREAEALRLAKEEAGQPFDLSCGPLLRASLLRLGAADHIFLLTQHHIVSDGWSMGIFSRELTSFYTAFLTGQPADLPELKLQYGDFAVWQRNWLQGQVLQEQLDYWERQLDGISVLQFPTDRPRPPLQSYRGATHTFHLPSSQVGALKRLAQSEGATPFMTLLAGFKALLRRYARQDDIAVGTYIANRNRAEVEPIIGFFVNTLVLRTEVSGDLTFRQLIRRVREVALGAYAHQDMPFEMLVERLQPDRDLSRNPLFQIVFQVPTNQAAPAESSTSATPLLEIKPASAAFDLSVSLWETGTQMTGQMEYSCDLFDAAAVERLAAHFVILLEAMVKDPDQLIERPSLLTPMERKRLLHDWNDTRRSWPADQSIIHLFERQAQQSPEATAFCFEGQELSYAALDRRANQLANYLRARGVQRELLVGICMRRSLEMVVALLAVWKAGGAYLPLDPSYPAERLSLMSTEARPVLLLTQAEFQAVCPTSAPVVLLDFAQPEIGQQSDANPEIRADPEQLAYVIFTSGSTGGPKAIAVEHSQILNRLWWMWEAYPFESGEVGSQKTALNFVDSLWELLGPLLRGVPSVIVPDAVLKDPWEFIELLSRHEVTRLWLVPSLLRTLLHTCPELGRKLPRLRFWVSSGEPLVAELLMEFQKLLPESRLYNLYGTSEVWDVTWFDPARGGAVAQSVPIGKPISNLEAYVLDEYLQLTPIGVPGELCVGGIGLARGYLHRPELTAEKFIPHPFKAEPGARLYRTGDLARFRSDGNLEFLGRMDQQVKIRGFRVEPGEVESMLQQHPEVRSAVVIARRDGGDSDPRLVAYVVPRPGCDAARMGWRDWLEQRLPGPMIPVAWVPLTELPLLPNGKVNRLALPGPDATSQPRRSAYAPPRTATEETLTRIWSDLLRVSQVGIRDHFFRDLGGHSLLATQVVSRVRNQFQVELPLRLLFQAPTVSEIALEIDRLKSGQAPSAPALQRVSRDRYRLPAGTAANGSGACTTPNDSQPLPERR